MNAAVNGAAVEAVDAVEAAAESATEILLGQHVGTDVGETDSSMLEATLMAALAEVKLKKLCQVWVQW